MGNCFSSDTETAKPRATPSSAPLLTAPPRTVGGGTTATSGGPSQGVPANTEAERQARLEAAEKRAKEVGMDAIDNICRRAIVGDGSQVCV